MLWKRIFGQSQRDDTAFAAYGCAVGQARSPGFYLHAGVPDTVEGRFEMVALHAWLILHRLQRQGEEAKAFGQRFFDIMFDDLDQTIRELGVGDLVVGKRINKLASAFYGRIAAYDAGLETQEDGMLKDALQRNIYQDIEAEPRWLELMAAYVRQVDAALAGQKSEDIMTGRITFPAVPADGSAAH